jgi:hypothetical protein
VAADAAFYSAKNEAAAKAKGVKRVCIPNRAGKSPARKREQKKWRTGCEGRRTDRLLPGPDISSASDTIWRRYLPFMQGLG